MPKFKVRWTEVHEAVVEAENEEIAVAKAAGKPSSVCTYVSARLGFCVGLEREKEEEIADEVFGFWA